MDPIPLNDLRRSCLLQASALEAAAGTVIRSGWWLNGRYNAEFAKAFSEYLGAKHCIGVANGTDALEIALRALLSQDARYVAADGRDASERLEVITVANAGGYSTAACHLVGCTPVYVDIDRESQLVSIDGIAGALSRKTAAVVVTHLYGGVVDVPAVRALLNRSGHESVPILEDCAQAHGAVGPAGKVGAFGDVSTFSFYPTKNLGALGDGGAVVTSRDDIAEQVRRLHQYGWTEKYRIGIPGGRNSRLDELQAAFLLAQLPQLDAVNERRQEIIRSYTAAAPKHVTFAMSPLGGVAHLAVLLTETRDSLRAHLHRLGIASDIHYPVLDCDQIGWRDSPHRVSGALAISRASVRQLLTVPCFPTMSDAEVERVAVALAEYRP